MRSLRKRFAFEDNGRGDCGKDDKAYMNLYAPETMTRHPGGHNRKNKII